MIKVHFKPDLTVIPLFWQQDFDSPPFGIPLVGDFRDEASCNLAFGITVGPCYGKPRRCGVSLWWM